MRAFKLILSLLPLLYIGGLLYYFTGVSGWSDGPMAGGLGPTVLGLAAVGLIFCIPLVFRLFKLVITPRGLAAVREDVAEEAGSDFDADAALARYLARKAAAGEPMPEAPAAFAPAASPQGEAPRPVFGRKTS